MSFMKKKGKEMMITGIVIAGLVVLVIAAFAVMGYQSRSGAAPGLQGGHLAACPDRPNCVSSETPEDKAHFIAPLNIPAEDGAAARAALARIIAAMGGRITVDGNDYLAATFTSRVFGFVDDLEIRIDSEGGLVHMRSASRVGYSDRGVNRKRIERLRKMFDKR